MRLAAPLRALPTRRCYSRRVVCASAAPPAEPPSAAEKEARLAANQLRTAGGLLAQLAPHVRTDALLPARLRDLAGERQFNSSSRRLYRELLWTAVRHWHALRAPHARRSVRG
jgi:hypothetical protein